MLEHLERIWREITARPSGPLAFRFYLQPCMAALMAVLDGIKDAHEGRPAYLWSLYKDPTHRRERMSEGWRAVRKIFFLAIVIDFVYQIIVLKGLRPIEGLFIAALLAIVPYVLLRGPVSRVVRRLGGPGAPKKTAA